MGYHLTQDELRSHTAYQSNDSFEYHFIISLLLPNLSQVPSNILMRHIDCAACIQKTICMSCVKSFDGLEIHIYY